MYTNVASDSANDTHMLPKSIQGPCGNSTYEYLSSVNDSSSTSIIPYVNEEHVIVEQLYSPINGSFGSVNLFQFASYVNLFIFHRFSAVIFLLKIQMTIRWKQSWLKSWPQITPTKSNQILFSFSPFIICFFLEYSSIENMNYSVPFIIRISFDSTVIQLNKIMQLSNIAIWVICTLTSSHHTIFRKYSKFRLESFILLFWFLKEKISVCIS